MIAVCGSGTALSAAQPPQTAIMDRIPGGRHVASTKALLNAHRKSQNVNLAKPYHKPDRNKPTTVTQRQKSTTRRETEADMA
jgi:hypothetical protein